MPTDEKPEQIRRLEQHLGLRLYPLQTGKITDAQNRKCYQLDDRGEIVGLNLSRCSIRDGSFLTGLPHLTALNLENNSITDGSFLKGLPYLTALDLGGNRVIDWSFLKGMTHLTSLALRKNGIIDWSFLKGLPHLTSFSLWGSSISDGAFLTGLSHLTFLDLRINEISDGAFLAGLPRLTSLYLGNNEIKDWSFLKGLPHLTALNLQGNGISDGTFLAGLAHLTSLSLWDNRIRDGSFLAELPRLTSLNVGNNWIRDWSFLAELPRLTSLLVKDSWIKDWSFLKWLPALKTLDIRQTSLKIIPSELLRLNVDLEWHENDAVVNAVNLASNPIETPPLEIVKQGDQAIRAWFAARDEGVVPLHEVKVIFAGDGEAGKTTLRKRLMGVSPDPKESQTHGIEIHPHTVRCGGDNIRVHFWDFGGQEILHATHQFFLSRRSLYVVVLDGRKEEDVDYWLKHIESFGGDSPVLICLNKMDQNPSFDVNRVDLRKKYPGIREFYRLKCLDTKDDGVAQLLRELPEQLLRIELTRAEWPRRWFDVKERLKKDDRPFLERDEFEGYCREAGIVDETSQHTLIRFLSDLGVALHFEDERLDLLQILNPKWATQAVYRLLSAPRVAEAHGLLKLSDLRDILAKTKPEDYAYPKDKHGYIVDLMRKFELCYDVNDKEVLLPDLLGVGEPGHEFPAENVLRFRYEYEYLPKSIMPRLIVKLHADIEDKLQWRTGVVLKSRRWNARARVKSDKNTKRVKVEVSGPQRRELFTVIFDAIETIHESFTKLDFKRKVPLPDRPDIAVDYEDLVFHRTKRRRTILVGEVQAEYPVDKLLDGIDLVQRRTKRTSAAGKGVHIEHVEHFHEGDDRSVTIGDGNRNIGVVIGDNVTQAVADSIQDSFNQAGAAKSDELKGLLQQLAREMGKVVEKLAEKGESEKVSEAATDLKSATEQATAEKPAKKYWELSKKGMIEAAQAVGAVGTVVLDLIGRISKLLPF